MTFTVFIKSFLYSKANICFHSRLRKLYWKTQRRRWQRLRCAFSPTNWLSMKKKQRPWCVFPQQFFWAKFAFAEKEETETEMCFFLKMFFKIGFTKTEMCFFSEMVSSQTNFITCLYKYWDIRKYQISFSSEKGIK